MCASLAHIENKNADECKDHNAQMLPIIRLKHKARNFVLARVVHEMFAGKNEPETQASANTSIRKKNQRSQKSFHALPDFRETAVLMNLLKNNQQKCEEINQLFIFISFIHMITNICPGRRTEQPTTHTTPFVL